MRSARSNHRLGRRRARSRPRSSPRAGSSSSQDRARSKDGTYAEGSIEDETTLTLENVGRLLEQAGSGFEHVVRCGVWLVDLADFAGMNGVYQSFFPEPRPARATVRADLIVGKVEIDCIALVAAP